MHLVSEICHRNIYYCIMKGISKHMYFNIVYYIDVKLLKVYY